jgi:hypothetical protein
MRMLCIGRHEYLSEHLCRFFSEAGTQCEPVVGVAEALKAAFTFEPHVIIAQSDVLSPAVLDAWSRESVLADVPILAVSLTRRPEENISADVGGIAGVIYLPTLDRADALALLEGARRPRGVDIPPDALPSAARQSVVAH